jgi:squalene cyclase
MIALAQLDSAIAAGRAFLLARRKFDGLWSDFQTEAGCSDEWVSGFAVYALAQDATGDTDVAATIDTLIARQRRNGGWGYNKSIPADCDSTGWVLMALSTAPPRKPSIAERGRRFLRSHQANPAGGFSTYLPRDGIDRIIGAPAGAVIDGWLHPQPCVTGLVLQSLLVLGEPVRGAVVRAATDYLLCQRDTSGNWPSYWWKGSAYSTYLCLRALWTSNALGKDTAYATVRLVASRQRPDGGWSDLRDGPSEVFATAFCLLALALFPERGVMADAERAAWWLLRHQEAAGQWPTAPILRIPTPITVRPDGMNSEYWNLIERGTGIIVADQDAIYTSAAALWALAAFRSLMRVARIC